MPQEESPKRILQSHGLRSTLTRTLVLQVFLENQGALAQSDLDGYTEGKINRASLYRILRDFEDKGLIHRVPDDVQANKFALCGQSCSAENHRDGHVHFKCEHCGLTSCMPEIPTPQVLMPKGYKIRDTQILLTGTCSQCAA